MKFSKTQINPPIALARIKTTLPNKPTNSDTSGLIENNPNKKTYRLSVMPMLFNEIGITEKIDTTEKTNKITKKLTFTPTLKKIK